MILISVSSSVGQSTVEIISGGRSSGWMIAPGTKILSAAENSCLKGYSIKTNRNWGRCQKHKTKAIPLWMRVIIRSSNFSIWEFIILIMNLICVHKKIKLNRLHNRNRYLVGTIPVQFSILKLQQKGKRENYCLSLDFKI